MMSSSRKTWTIKTINQKDHGSRTISKQFLLGVLCAVGSGLSSAFASIVSNNLRYIPTIQITMQRYMLHIFLSFMLLNYYKETPLQSRKAITLLSFRTTLLVGRSFLAFLGLNYIPLAEHSVISGCVPIFSTIFAKVFIGESFGLINVSCLLLALIGLILISKLPETLFSRTVSYDLTYLWGILMTVASTILAAGSAVIVRVPLVKEIHCSVVFFYTGSVAIVACSVLTSIFSKFSSGTCGFGQWMMILLSFMGSFSDLSVILGLQQKQVFFITIIYSASNIITAFLWQLFVEKVFPDIYGISGTSIMVFCVILSSCSERILKAK